MKLKENKKHNKKMNVKETKIIEAMEGKINPNEFKRDSNNEEQRAGHFGKKYFPYKK